MHAVRKDGGAKEISQRTGQGYAAIRGWVCRTAIKKLSKRGPRFDLLNLNNHACQDRSSRPEGHGQCAEAL
jgi:hypothetical protein